MNENTHNRLHLKEGRLPIGNHSFTAYPMGEFITNFNPFNSHSRVSRISRLIEVNFVYLFTQKSIFHSSKYLFTTCWIVFSHILLMCRNSLNQLFISVTSFRSIKDIFDTLSLNKMGADPILKSAIGRQGCRHSNQGGIIKCQ